MKKILSLVFAMGLIVSNSISASEVDFDTITKEIENKYSDMTLRNVEIVDLLIKLHKQLFKLSEEEQVSFIDHYINCHSLGMYADINEFNYINRSNHTIEKLKEFYDNQKITTSPKFYNAISIYKEIHEKTSSIEDSIRANCFIIQRYKLEKMRSKYGKSPYIQSKL